MPFERAIEELESIVKRLEEGKVPLEESVAIYERGEVLKRRCEDLLRQAEARVEKITLDATGKPTGTSRSTSTKPIRQVLPAPVQSRLPPAGPAHARPSRRP